MAASYKRPLNYIARKNVFVAVQCKWVSSLEPILRTTLIPSHLIFGMAAPPSAYKDRHFLAVIGDEVRMLVTSLESIIAYSKMQDSVTGLLLAGIGVGTPASP